MQLTQTRTTATQTPAPPAATWAMLAGLALTIIAAALAALDPMMTDSVASHVRDAYPEWDADTVSTEQTAIIGWLVGTGALGVIGWISSIWAVRAQKRWALWFATTWFALGVVTAGATLSMGGEAYDVIVPTPLGVLSALPVLAGIAALIQLWRHRQTA